MRGHIAQVAKDYQQRNTFLAKIAKALALQTTILIVFINAHHAVQLVLHAKGQLKIAHHALRDTN
jgi:hypothetical protein